MSKVKEVQALLSEYSYLIDGRMGIPDRERKVSVINVQIRGRLEDISALTGKLGKIENVLTKSALLPEN
jgi:putative iron-only hydrogenase system regulator